MEYFSMIRFDVVSMFVLGGLLFAWSMYRGKHGVKLFILSLYVLSVLFAFIPLNFLIEGKAPFSIWLIKGGIMLLLAISMALVLKKNCLVLPSHDVLWEKILLSLLAILFFGILIFSIASPDALSDGNMYLTPAIEEFFTNQGVTWWGTLLPILGVMFL
jgi:hypothetical protein